MGIKIDTSLRPEQTCIRFERCSINKCILCKDYNKLLNDSSDSAKINKEKCIPKKRRKMIGKAFSLSNGGLTPKEESAMKLYLESTRGNQEKSSKKGMSGLDSTKYEASKQ